MLRLEYWFDEKAFRVAVVAAKRQHFTDDAAAWLTLDMNDEINGFSDLCFGIGERCLRVVSHNQIGETTEGLFRRIGVDCCERSSVPGVEGIEKRPRFDSAHFAKDDPVGS